MARGEAAARWRPEDIEHHIEEEETEIFPLAQKLLDSGRLNTIAGEIEKAKAAHEAEK